MSHPEMQLDDLDLRELLEFRPKGGIIRFAGDRALILDAVALGLLRRTLIETEGDDAARGILTRFGYAHGQRTAITMKKASSKRPARGRRTRERLSGDPEACTITP
jgi:hypothetical protein